MVEVLGKAEPCLGSPLLAYAWYRSEPLMGFSGQTAMHLVQNNGRTRCWPISTRSTLAFTPRTGPSGLMIACEHQRGLM